MIGMIKAYGLEVRTPYLDMAIFRYASKIPVSIES